MLISIPSSLSLSLIFTTLIYFSLINTSVSILCQASHNRILVGGVCVCMDGFYENGTPTCPSCNFPCLTCVTTATTCTNCDSTLKLTLSGSTCICMDGYVMVMSVCQPCHYSCATCSGTASNNCLTCNTTIRLYVSTSFKCPCLNGTYDNSTTQSCQPCNIKCLWCSASTTNDCTNCDTNLVRIIGTSNPGPCLCQPGYYDIPNIVLCGQCNYTCLTCMTLSTTCLSCNSGQFRTISGTSCPCNSHYYDSGVAICSMCSPRCGNCVTAPTTCLTCNNTFRILSGTNCPCIDGYYQDITTVTLDCKPCTNYCKTCTNTSSTCLSCYSGYNRLLNNATCNCISGYYDNGTITCQLCPYYCLTCIGPSPPSCTSCDTTKHRTLSNNLCPCDTGYYDSGIPTCQPCSYSCLTCSSSPILCTSCSSINHRILTATDCNCTVGYYDDYTNALCPSCHYSCVSCFGGLSYQCYTCQINRNYTNYSCPCNTGMYQAGQYCYYCDILCNTCVTISTYCTSCSTDRMLSNNTCICANGYYASGASSCSLCSQQCQTCIETANTCLSCPASHLTILSFSSCICPISYYMPTNSLICSPCHYSCLTCQSSALSTDCLSCNSTNYRTFVIATGSCICDTIGYYDAGVALCGSCHYTCLSCTGGSSQYNCTACVNSSYWLIGSYCRPRLTCTNYNYNGNCVNVCPDGSYGIYSPILLGNICTQCINNCLTCNSALSCLTCQPNTYLFTMNNSCVQQCGQGYYISLSNDQCLPCPSSCLQCAYSIWDNAVVCSMCKPGYIMEDYGKCVIGCENGYALNSTDNRCHRCPSNCKLCITNTNLTPNCTQCQPTYLLLNSICYSICPLGYTPSISGTSCVVCPIQCMTCYLNNCLSCAQGYYLSDVLQCIQEGYFRNSTGVITKCHDNCVSCTDTSFSSCITCQQYRGDSAQMAISGYCDCQQDVLDIGPGLCDIQGQYQGYRSANKVVIGASHASVYLGVVLSVLSTNFLPVISFVNYMQTYSNMYFVNMSTVLQTDKILHQYRKINPITYYRSTFNTNPSSSISNSLMKNIKSRLLVSTQMDQSLFLRGDQFVYLVQWGFPAFVVNVIVWGVTLFMCLCRCLCKGKCKNSVHNIHYTDIQQKMMKPTVQQSNRNQLQTKNNQKQIPLSLQKQKSPKSQPQLESKQKSLSVSPQTKPSAATASLSKPTKPLKCLCCRCPFILKYSLQYYISYCLSLHHQSTAIIIYLLTYQQIILYAAFFFKTLYRLRHDDSAYPIDALQITLSVILTVYYIVYPLRLAIGAYRHNNNKSQSSNKSSSIRILFHKYRQSATTSKSHKLFLPLLLIRNTIIPILIVFLAFNPLYQCLSVTILTLISMLVNLCICPYESVMRVLIHMSDLVLVLQFVILTVTSTTPQNNRILASQVLIIANFVQVVIMALCCAWLLYTVFRDRMCNTHKKKKSRTSSNVKESVQTKHTLHQSPYHEDSLANIVQKQQIEPHRIEQQLQLQPKMPVKVKVNGLPLQQFNQWPQNPMMTGSHKIASSTPPQYTISNMNDANLAAITKSKSETKITKKYRVKRKQDNNI